MWILNQTNEDNRIKKKSDINSIILWSSIFAILGTWTFKSRGCTSRFSIANPIPMSWNDTLLQLPLIVLLSVIIAYVAVKLDKRKKGKATFICDKCNIQRNEAIEGQKCECGGFFYHIDKMKWIDEE